MKTKEIKKTIYIADDGKEFLTEEECASYEKEYMDIKKNVKYFSLYFQPDLTETGYFQGYRLIAVYAEFFHEAIAEEYVLREITSGHKICEGVQGFRVAELYNLSSISEREYKLLKEEKKAKTILLSPKEIKGFEKKYDYGEKWGLKL